MEVILLEKVHNLGNLGKQVTVKPGYARNYLLPKGKAVTATPENKRKFELRRAELEKAAQEIFSKAQERAKTFENILLEVAARASDEGKLFGSVGPRELVEAFEKLGLEVDKAEILLPEGPFRQTGEHEVSLQLHSDIRVAVKLMIIAEA